MALIDTIKHQLQQRKEQKHLETQWLQFQRLLYQRIYDNDATLDRMGLPVPQRTTEPTVRPIYKAYDEFTDCSTRIMSMLPKFVIPPHFSIRLNEKLWVTLASNTVQARGKRLSEVVGFPHVTADRDPYDFYKKCNIRGENSLAVGDDAERWLAGLRLPDSPPRQLPNLTLADAAGIEFRIEMFSNFTDYKRNGETSPALMYEPEQLWFSNFILKEAVIDMPLQVPAFGPPLTQETYKNLKVLPAEEIKPAQMTEFWDSLRPLNCPIAFELIATLGSVYFRLGVPARHVVSVQRTLERYFPRHAVMLCRKAQ